jgi:predicted dehydrogenase
MEKLRIALIGSGFMGLNVAEAIRVEPSLGLELRGIAEQDDAVLRRAATKYRVQYAVTDYKELIERDDIDIVAIFTPDHLHAEQILDSLDAGKHVICTKPLVTTMKDCERVVRKVDETGLKLLTAETARFHRLFLAAKEMLDNGELGKPIYVQAHYVHDLRKVLKATPWRETVPQDWLIGGGCHAIDLVRWFAGEVSEVHAYANKSGLPGYEIYERTYETNFLLNLKFESGCIGRVLSAHGVIEPPIPMESFWLFGTRGTIVDNEIVLERDGKLERKTLRPSRDQELAEKGMPSPEEEIRGHLDEVIRFLKHFEICVREDRNPSPDAREGARDVSVALAAWDSIKEGRPVKPRIEF